VIVPSTPRDGKGLLASAIFDEDPCLFVETIRLQAKKGLVPTDPGFAIPLGQADVKRPGSDVTLISYGRSVLESLAAADTLDEQGISAEVIDLRTLVPLDTQTILTEVAKTGRLVTVEENPRLCGWGAEISSIVSEELFWDLDGPIVRVTTPHVPLSAANNLEDMQLPTPERIVSSVRQLVD